MAETRWWWVRHAPVTQNSGRIYGATDPLANTDDTDSYIALDRLLPDNARWVTSHLQRTRQTADAIASAGNREINPSRERGLGEQDFGDWHGLSYEEHARSKLAHRFWIAPAETRPPNGESFVDLCKRTEAVIARLTAAWNGRDIVAIAHGGTIRAALRMALGLDADTALRFVIENLSVNRIDHFAATERHPESWRVVYTNRLPHLRH